MTSILAQLIKQRTNVKAFVSGSNFINFRMASSSSLAETVEVKRSAIEVVDTTPDAKKQKTEVVVDEKQDVKSVEATSSKETAKVPRKKVAMLLSYSGVGYKGMQINPGARTIEKDLVQALVKAGAIPAEHGHNMGKMMFQRCARTDKGVSAVGQVVSLKMCLLDNLVEKINQHLPKVIKVMDVKRTTGSFNSKHHCNYRTYSYLLPSFALQDVKETTTEKYRISDEKLKEVNDLLAVYKGTKNFHNFTSGKLSSDASAKRYIMDMTCERTFEDEGLEFLLIKVKGQSFMLHQIRKMVGLMIAIVRGVASKSTLDKAFGDEKLDMSRAPGLGLLLEMVHYDAYNEKWGGDGLHEVLTWEDSKEKLEDFKRKFIYPNIIVREKYNKSMMHWLSTLPLHSFDVITGHNPMRSSLVDAKIQIKAEKRESDADEEEIDGLDDQIPPDVDLSDWKPGQNPTQFLQTLSSVENPQDTDATTRNDDSADTADENVDKNGENTESESIKKEDNTKRDATQVSSSGDS